MKHYLEFIQESVRKFWNEPALTDFDTDVNYTYGQMAEAAARMHLLFKAAGVQKGDKIALCGRNSAGWAVSFLSIVTYEAVVVSILSDFSPESAHHLVNHSDAKLLIVGDVVQKHIDFAAMPHIQGVLSTKDASLIYCRNTGLQQAAEKWQALFSEAWPKGYTPECVNYPTTNNMEELALINYTSGTTSDPKGVMLSNRSLSSNVLFGQNNIPNQPGWNVVSILPLAHMFGLTFEFLYQLAGGTHIYFLGRNPSPQILMKAFAEVHPYMLLTVPLVVEKIFHKGIFPIIHKPLMRVLWYTPGISTFIRKKVHDQLMDKFGGKLQHLIIGGAALNHEVETCLRQINFCYTVGYGMTECGPILAYEHWSKFAPRSCGKAVERMQVAIDSSNPNKNVGEIIVQGDNVMLGYYKNEEATKAILNKEGWLRTGDLGLIDKEGNIYIKGRSKSVIIGSSGQNIYPEEIEGKLNNQLGVSESVVVSRDGKLVGLVYPDMDMLKEALKTLTLEECMENARQHANRSLPAFCHLSSIEVVDKEFEKTPKRSIKRFMYK